MNTPSLEIVRTLSAVGVVVGLAATVACGRGSDTRQPASAPGASATPASATSAAAPTGDGPSTIQVVRVVEQALDVPLSLPGELTAFQSVAVFARVGGFVRSIAVDRGSRVRTGDLLAVLDAPELVAQRSEAESKVQAAEAQLAVARSKADADRSTFDRLKAAAATPGVVAGNDVDVAEKSADASANQVVAAQHAVEAARQALSAVRDVESYLRVTAPFGGVVTERNVHPGALVGPTSGAGATPLLRIVDASRLRLIVPVPEAYTADVKAGTNVSFTVAAYPGQTFTGQVARIAQSVDVSTRTMAIELDVANPDGRLAPGAFCQVRWPVRRASPSLFVPSTSVAATTDRTFVTRIRDGKAEWVDVRTGLTAGALVEVFGQLHAGDEVAVRGSDEVRPGTPVRPQESKPPA